MNRTLSKRLGGTLLIAGLVTLMPLSAFADREHHRRHHEKEHDRGDRDHDRGRHERDHTRRQPSTVISFGLNVRSAPPVRYSQCPEPVEYYAPRVYYYDPYCERRFATFDLYVEHVGCRRHPGYVRVRDCDDDNELYAYRRAPQGWLRVRF